MSKVKVMSIFGTRPEAIKMAPLIKELEKNENIESLVCVTAQHREMLDQVLEIFKIKPDYDLDIMKSRQTLTDILTGSLVGIEEVLKKESPDLVLVHGDTSTTFAGALMTFYHQKKVGHVEAGLRTYDKYQPFPEEMNRVLTTRLADFNFAPTTLSKNNLLKENISPDTIFVTGNTVIDCLKFTIKDDYIFNVDMLNNIDYKNKKIIVVTAHRRENLGEPLKDICNAVLDIVENNEDVEVVYAVHLNPAVRETAHNILGDNDRIHLCDPLDLLDMHNLLHRSHLVLTDSGGLQEEVISMKKPVVVLRNVTERPEGVDAGALKLAGTERKNVFEITDYLLKNEDAYKKMAQTKNPFGDGKASERIVDAILYSFGINENSPEDFS